MLNRTLTSHFVRTALGWLGTAAVLFGVLVLLATVSAYLGSEMGP